MNERATRNTGPCFWSIAPDEGESSLTCPKCGGNDLVRIRRRVVDRLLSIFVKLRRYRCPEPRCEWVGNLKKN